MAAFLLFLGVFLLGRPVSCRDAGRNRVPNLVDNPTSQQLEKANKSAGLVSERKISCEVMAFRIGPALVRFRLEGKKPLAIPCFSYPNPHMQQIEPPDDCELGTALQHQELKWYYQHKELFKRLMLTAAQLDLLHSYIEQTKWELIQKSETTHFTRSRCQFRRSVKQNQELSKHALDCPRGSSGSRDVTFAQELTYSLPLDLPSSSGRGIMFQFEDREGFMEERSRRRRSGAISVYFPDIQEVDGRIPIKADPTLIFVDYTDGHRYSSKCKDRDGGILAMDWSDLYPLLLQYVRQDDVVDSFYKTTAHNDVIAAFKDFKWKMCGENLAGAPTPRPGYTCIFMENHKGTHFRLVPSKTNMVEVPLLNRNSMIPWVDKNVRQRNTFYWPVDLNWH